MTNGKNRLPITDQCIGCEVDQSCIRPKFIERVKFYYLKGREKPFEVIRWELAEVTGWTLEYIDSLSVADMHTYEMIKMGRNKARK